MGTPPVTCRVSELGGLSAISPALGPFLCPTRSNEGGPARGGAL